MSRLVLAFVVLGVSLLLLSGCFGGSPAKPSSNNTSIANSSAPNPTTAPNASSPPSQNQSQLPNQPAVPNGTSPVPSISNTPSSEPVTPPAPEPVTPPAILITPTVSGDAVVDPTNGIFTTGSCYGIEARPDVIKAGKESTLRFRFYAAHSEAITYTCGEDVLSKGNGGLNDFTKICRYPAAGHYTVWVALDGYVCASMPLEVVPADAASTQPSCTVAANSQNEARNGTETTYSAKVMLYNQLPRASVEWDCGQTHFSRTVGEVFNPSGSVVSDSGISGSLLVTCSFDTWPPPSPGSVSIEGVDCGSMVAGG